MWADSLMRGGCGVPSSLNDSTSSLLRLSSALVPPVLTETITPSCPVTQQQFRMPRAVHNASPGRGQGEANKLGVQGRPTMAIMGYMGGGPWMSMCVQAPTRAIRCQGHIMVCPLFSTGCPQTSKEAAWYQRGTRGSLVGDQEIPGKFSEYSGDHW